MAEEPARSFDWSLLGLGSCRVHKLQGIQTVGQARGDRGIPLQELLPIRLVPRFERGQILLDGPDHTGIFQPGGRRLVVHRFIAAGADRMNAVTTNRPVFAFPS